jgi:hypothetical protein
LRSSIIPPKVIYPMYLLHKRCPGHCTPSALLLWPDGADTSWLFHPQRNFAVRSPSIVPFPAFMDCHTTQCSWTCIDGTAGLEFPGVIMLRTEDTAREAADGKSDRQAGPMWEPSDCHLGCRIIIYRGHPHHPGVRATASRACLTSGMSHGGAPRCRELREADAIVSTSFKRTLTRLFPRCSVIGHRTKLIGLP